MVMHRTSFFIPLSIFGVSLIVFTIGLPTQEVIRFDSRSYLFAQEMLRYGIGFFPTAYQQPYPDYSSASTLLIYFFAKLFGGLNKLIAVLPTAIAASMTVVFTYLIGAIHSKRLGFYAILFLFLTIAFFKNARAIALDMYPTLITVWCFYLIYSASTRQWWIYFLLFLSFIFRGPIGLVIPVGVICSYYFLDRQYRTLFLFGLRALFILIIGMIFLCLLAYYTGGKAFISDVLRMQILGRMHHDSVPIYFYIKDVFSSYALSFPIAFLVLIGIVIAHYKKYRLPEKVFLLKLLGWIAIILIGMSIPGDKKTRYILPIAPAISLFSAYLFVALNQDRYFSFLRQFFLSIFLFLPAIFLLLTEIIFYYAKNNNLTFPISYASIAITFIILQIIALFLAFRNLQNRNLYQDGILSVATLSFVMAYIGVIEPIDLYINRARDFVVAIETLRKQNNARLVFYKEKSDSMPIKYLINMPQFVQPVFISELQELNSFSQPAFFVTSRHYFLELPASQFNIIAYDTLGRVNVVVFTKKERH